MSLIYKIMARPKQTLAEDRIHNWRVPEETCDVDQRHWVLLFGFAPSAAISALGDHRLCVVAVVFEPPLHRREAGCSAGVALCREMIYKL